MLLRLFTGFLLLLCVSCTSSSPECEAVLQIGRLRDQALQTRNLSLYSTIISPAYYDRRARNQAQVLQELQESFRHFESVSYSAEGRTVTIDGKNAELAGTYRMKVVIRGKEILFDGKEQLTLARDSSGWKIVAGL